MGGESTQDIRNRIEKEWDSLNPGDIDLNHILDRIHHIINKSEISRKQKFGFRLLRFYSKAAAFLILPLLLAGLLLIRGEKNKYTGLLGEETFTSIYSPEGTRSSFRLPDGTTGMLNGGSKLSYSLPFSKNRNTELSGEAWFDVTSDAAHPFTITAGNTAIKVLGTSFNVSAYSDEDYVDVVVKEGAVEFSFNENQDKITLLPSERIIFKNGETFKSNADPDKYIGWTEGKLVFNGDPMTEVIRRIENWYNVIIHLADKELEQYSFRATFVDDSLEDVLKFLSITSPITYEISDRRQLSDGKFIKEEITIYKVK